MKYFLMHPPRWMERILSRISSYRKWYIIQVCKTLHEDVMKYDTQDYVCKLIDEDVGDENDQTV